MLIYVITKNVNIDDYGWIKGALDKQKFGVHGRIIDSHGGHGRVYLVKHDDDSEAWYEPIQLELV